MASHVDDLKSRPLSKDGEAQWDKIFGVKKKEPYIPPPLPDFVVKGKDDSVIKG